MRWSRAGDPINQTWLARRGLTALALLTALTIPVVVLAHPLGNFTVNHYSQLELSPGHVRIFYVLDMAESPTFQTIQTIDRNGDGKIDAAEGEPFATAKMEELRRGVQLAVAGKPVDLRASAPDLSLPPGQGGLSLLRLTFWMDGALPAARTGAVAAEYRDTNETERLGWREIVVRGQDGLRIGDADVSDTDRSNELRQYPQDMLSSPLNQTAAHFSFQGVASQPSTSAGASVPALGSAKNDGAFAALITLPRLDLPVVLLALLTALGLGALHALEPGHGKTAAAAYLVGSRATARHAIVLGLTITAMHTSSVFILGLVTLFAARLIVPERLLPWLGLASGLIVVALGVNMVATRLRARRGGMAGGHSHADGHHHDHDHDHSHPHDHRHDHGPPDHDHDHGHAHPLPAVLTGERVGWRGVLAVGISGGLLPCPAALIVLLSAIGLGRVGFGLLLIVAFSAGLALVLSVIGLTVLYGGRWLSRSRPGLSLVQVVPGGAQLVQWMPALSGLLVVGAGFLLLYHALPLLRVWQR